jgi:thiol-disulfide isomerase/thioredoxin
MFTRAQWASLPLIILLAIAVFLSPQTSSAAEGEVLESKILKNGVKAPMFTAPSLEGEQYVFDEVVGRKPVILFFWSFFCGPCREEMPVLQQVYEDVGTDKIEFIGVNLDGPKLSKAITKFLSDSNLTFVSVFDELEGLTYKVADPYGVAGTPTSYIIDLDGNIAFSSVGQIEAEEVKKLLNDILAGG